VRNAAYWDGRNLLFAARRFLRLALAVGLESLFALSPRAGKLSLLSEPLRKRAEAPILRMLELSE